MTQYNNLNVKLSNPDLNKIKSGIKNGTKVSLNLSSNVIGGFNDATNFPHKLLLINTQDSRICKAFANGLSANIKFSKNQLSKMVQLSESLFNLMDLQTFSNFLLMVFFRILSFL